MAATQHHTQPMHTATLLLALLPLAASCGGSTDPVELTKNGEKALGIRDYVAAYADFDAALRAIDSETSHAMYVRAKLGAIEASAAVAPARAIADLLALHRAMPSKVSETDFNRIAENMAAAKKLKEAIGLLEEGKGLFPESKLLDALGDRLVKEAESADDPEALEALAGLGYAGDE